MKIIVTWRFINVGFLQKILEDKCVYIFILHNFTSGRLSLPLKCQKSFKFAKNFSCGGNIQIKNIQIKKYVCVFRNSYSIVQPKWLNRIEWKLKLKFFIGLVVQKLMKLRINLLIRKIREFTISRLLFLVELQKNVKLSLRVIQFQPKSFSKT